jgi:hypothetical protein
MLDCYLLRRRHSHEPRLIMLIIGGFLALAAWVLGDAMWAE